MCFEWPGAKRGVDKIYEEEGEVQAGYRAWVGDSVIPDKEAVAIFVALSRLLEAVAIDVKVLMISAALSLILFMLVWSGYSWNVRYDRCMVSGWQSACANIREFNPGFDCDKGFIDPTRTSMTWNKYYCYSITGFSWVF